MGEIICPNCDYMNSHIYCHATGKCEKCGATITYCESCNCSISVVERPLWELILNAGRHGKLLSKEELFKSMEEKHE